MYLIQGFFFQNRQYLDTRCVPREGLIPVIDEGLFRTMYAGIITRIPGQPDTSTLIGHVDDHYGHSVIREIKLESQRFSFIKKYERRSDLIRYEFKRIESNTWIGTYQGIAVGTGVSCCFLTEVSGDLIDASVLCKLLGIREPYCEQ